MEGVASEAASLAGHLKLGKLIYLYDDNHITLAAGTAASPSPKIAPSGSRHMAGTRKSVEDGNDLDAIERAIRARAPETRTSLADSGAHAHRLWLAAQAGYLSAHGSPLGEEEVRLTKQNLGWPVEPPFLVPDGAARTFARRSTVASGPKPNGTTKFSAYAQAFPELARELRQLIAANCLQGGMRTVPQFPGRCQGHGHPRRLGQGA